MRAVVVIASRDLRKWVNRRPVLVVSLLTPLIWITLFGKSFNIQSILVPGDLPPQLAGIVQAFMEERLRSIFGTTDYFTFFAAGMLVVFALFQSMFSGVSVIFDKRLGYMERLLASPIPRASIFLGKVAASLARISLLGALLLGASIILGMDLKDGITVLDFIAAWLVIMTLSLGLASAYTALSFHAENQEVVFAVSNLVNLPLMFTSSAIFPVEQMPSWLQTLAKGNPITYASDLVRYHLVGKPLPDYTSQLALLAAISLILFAIGLLTSVRWMTNR